jgi:cell division protein FtsZ
MKNGGVAILGKAEVAGENRAERAIEEALNSPLLNDNDIKGAKWILLNINSAEGEFECSMDELEVINNILRERTGEHSDVIMGMGYDETLGEKLGITLIATGFEHKDPFKKEEPKKAEAPVEEKIVMTLVTEEPAKPAPVVEVAAGNQIQDEFEVPAEDNHFILEMEQEAPEEIAVFTVAAAEMMETMQEEAIVEEEEMEEEEMEEEEMEEAATVFEEPTIEFDLAPTLMEEEVAYASVYVSAPEEEVMEEEAPAFFELTMEETAFETPTEFILNKPTNIYVEDSMESAIEAAVENVMEEDALVIAATTEEALIEEEVFESPLFEASSFEEAVDEEALFEEEVAPVVFETSFRTVTPSNEDAFVTPSQMAVAEDNQDMQLVLREDNVASNKPNHQNYDMPIDDTEEQRRKVAERIQKLRNLSFNINNSSDPNNEFDAVPAYVRRNLDLFGNTMASVENYYSKYTVEKDENNQTQISTINSFLDGKKPD